MGSLMADLEKNLASLNKWLEKHGKDQMSKNDLLLKLFREVEYVWPQLGYPPLVTPFSQYVKNVALMNVIQMAKGQQRWSMIDENTWSMILGKTGQLPGPVGEEIQKLAQEQGREFYTGNPQDLYPDSLADFMHRLSENQWSPGTDNEELFEYAMHPREYEELKSGQAAKSFAADVETQKRKAAPISVPAESSAPLPKSFVVDVNGESYTVKVSYNGQDSSAKDGHSEKQQASRNGTPTQKNGSHSVAITSPLEGKFFLTKESSERGLAIGDIVRKGDTVAYIESMKVINAITADKEGKVSEIVARHGSPVEEDDVIIRLTPA